ncbi:DUF6378 domain-containing protein [Streptomyces sp. 796.1]|uniref:DUF6378 domain-containing protein n=1 Tax=Streptomyces sp. 796.1 TaxID=3163029 RepID=UPI0039C97E8A
MICTSSFYDDQYGITRTCVRDHSLNDTLPSERIWHGDRWGEWHTPGDDKPEAAAEETEPPRAGLLNEARNLVVGDRNTTHGEPYDDFQRTAGALTALGYRRYDDHEQVYVDLAPSDVAVLVAAVKLSRLMHSRANRDNWTDLAGYAACGYECTTREPAVNTNRAAAP